MLSSLVLSSRSLHLIAPNRQPFSTRSRNPHRLLPCNCGHTHTICHLILPISIPDLHHSFPPSIDHVAIGFYQGLLKYPVSHSRSRQLAGVLVSNAHSL